MPQNDTLPLTPSANVVGFSVLKQRSRTSGSGIYRRQPCLHPIKAKRLFLAISSVSAVPHLEFF